MPNKLLSQEEWGEWRQNPATQEVLRVLRLRLKQGQQEWAAGGFQADTIEKTALLNAEAVGKYAALSGLIEMDYETYVSYAEEIEDA